MIDPTNNGASLEGYKSAIEHFLNDVHGGANLPCVWRFIDYAKKKKPENRKHKTFQEVASEIQYFGHEDRREVFYSLCPSIESDSPTKGKGRAKSGIMLPRAFLVDLDQKKALGISKEEILLKADSICTDLKIPYTHRITTRNGYHLYWTFSSPVEEGLWKRVQKQLSEVFLTCGSDGGISFIAVSTRLPYTWHWKDNLEPFQMPLHFSKKSPYAISDFIGAIGVEENEPLLLPTRPPRIDSSLPKSRRREEIKQALEDAKYDLGLICSHLGVSTGKHLHFRCPYPEHADKNPSAGIFNSKAGYVFNCFGCQVRGDIVELIKRDHRLTGKSLVVRILKMSGREDLLDFKPVDLNYLDKNLELLNEFLAFTPFYNGTKIPLYNSTKGRWVQRFLTHFIELAKKKVRNLDSTFPASLIELAGGKSNATERRRLYLMRLIGLVEIAQIPEALRTSHRRFKAGRKFMSDTSWHYIPEWTLKGLETAFAILEEANDNKINTGKCTRAQIREVYGVEAEARVFHGRSVISRRAGTATKRRLFEMPPNFEIEEYEEHQRKMEMLTEEELEHHIFEAGGEEALKKYRKQG